MRVRVRHLRALVVALHHRQLGGVERRGRRAHAGRRDRHEQVAHGRLVADLADELAHHAEPAGAGDRALLRVEVAGDDPQQRGLAGAVGADEGDLRAVADPERRPRRAAPGRPAACA